MVVRGPWFACEVVLDVDEVVGSRCRAAGAEISAGLDVNWECTVPRIDLGSWLFAVAVGVEVLVIVESGEEW